MELQRTGSIKALRSHLLPNGAVVASSDPEYCYEWKRDSAIVRMELLESDLDHPLSWIENHTELDEKFRSKGRHHRLGGLSAARHNRDGLISDHWWASPQHDGPALQLLAMSAEGMAAMKAGDRELARRLLDAVLDYGNHAIATIGDRHFCPWEEVKAEDHFWTAMSRFAGFFAAYLFCDAMGKHEQASRFYDWHYRSKDRAMAFLKDRLYRRIFPHLNVVKKDSIILKSLPPVDSHVMSALLLVHESALRWKDPEFVEPIPITDVYALRTVAAISEFSSGFPVNKTVKSSEGAILIGRYPWDRYGGPRNLHGGGNLWPLLTFDFGNYMFRLATVYLNDGKIDASEDGHEALRQLTDMPNLPNRVIPETDPFFSEIITALSERGNAQIAAVLKRTMFFKTDPNLDIDHLDHIKIPEQLDRETGKPNPDSVSDLGWNHARFLAVYRAREEFEEALQSNFRKSPQWWSFSHSLETAFL